VEDKGNNCHSNISYLHLSKSYGAKILEPRSSFLLLASFFHPPITHISSANHEVTNNCNGRDVHSLLLHGVGISTWHRSIVAGISFIEI
jgi:hypothetical protein